MHAPLIERVRFAYRTDSAQVHTEGREVIWKSADGDSGRMPLELFKAVALRFAEELEQRVFVDGDDGDGAYEQVHSRLSTPVRVAAAHPASMDRDVDIDSIEGAGGVRGSAWVAGFDRDCVDEIRPLQVKGGGGACGSTAKESSK